MATIQEINSSIISGQFTNDQLDEIIMAIKFARNQLAKQNKGTLVVGAKAKFTSGRTGQVMIGTVEKINRKYIVVRTQQSLFRVPANMLESV